MFVHRITFRNTAQAVVAAALGAALLAGPAGARPADHDSVAPATTPVAVYHDSIATSTSPVATYHDSIAPKAGTSTVVAFHDSMAQPGGSPSAGGNAISSPSTNPKVFAAATTTTHDTSGSDLSSATIGLGLLAAALAVAGIAALHGRSTAPRPRSHQGKPSFS